MSAPDSSKNPDAKEPPSFTKPARKRQPANNGQRAVVRPVQLEVPRVEVPKHETSRRTAQINFRVEPEVRDWVSRQSKLVQAETGLKDNQVSALLLQILTDAITSGELRYRAMLEAGLIEPEQDDEGEDGEASEER